MWKTVKECDLYEVSDKGQVRRKDSGHILQGCVVHGYHSVKFTYPDGQQKRFRVHRLVAEHFLPTPLSNQNEVNHKDGNKLNNCVENLEWVSHRENILHYYQKLRKEKKTKKNNGQKVPVIQCDLQGNEIARYTSVSEASRATGIKIGAISYVINGRFSHTGEYTWKRQ